MKEIKKFGNVALPQDKTSIYGNVDGLSLQNLFYSKYGCFPACYLFESEQRTNSDYTFDTKKMIKFLTENIPAEEKMELSPYLTKVLGSKDDKVDVGFCVVLNKSKILARFEKSVVDSYVLFSNENFEDAEKLINALLEFYVAPDEIRNNYWRIASSQSGYYLEKGKIKCPADFSVEKLYNDDFLKEDKKICDFIEEDEKSGLVILHGKKGTGKSTYIKNLVSKYPNKKFVYVPANLIKLLGDPTFGSFLASLNNCVIILEDCEDAIRSRGSNFDSGAVSLLLNMTDGILADDLSIKFICTFNEDMKNIDEALLRKGRLITKYEFKGLEPQKANELLQTRGIEANLTSSITLADIFHYGEDSYEKQRTAFL